MGFLKNWGYILFLILALFLAIYLGSTKGILAGVLVFVVVLIIDRIREVVNSHGWAWIQRKLISRIV